MTEYFYTFLIPIIFELSGVRYLVWGYREVDNEVVGFMATLTSETVWTDAKLFSDPELLSEFKKYLPEKKQKRKRKKSGV